MMFHNLSHFMACAILYNLLFVCVSFNGKLFKGKHTLTTYIKTSRIDATSFMYALGVKNIPSANILSVSSMDMDMTKMYSATCRMGVDMTLKFGVSNINEMHDRVVTQIITQSTYVTRLRKLLEQGSACNKMFYTIFSCS